MHTMDVTEIRVSIQGGVDLWRWLVRGFTVVLNREYIQRLIIYLCSLRYSGLRHRSVPGAMHLFNTAVKCGAL